MAPTGGGRVSESQRHLDLWGLAQPSLALAAAIFVVLFGLIIVVLRGSSRGHRVLLESFVVLMIGLPLSVLAAVSDFNLSRDTSAPRQLEYRIMGTWDTDTNRRRRDSYGTMYFLKLAPVTPGAPIVRPFLRVTQATYIRAEKGQLVRITSRVGRLNIPWMVRLEIP